MIKAASPLVVFLALTADSAQHIWWSDPLPFFSGGMMIIALEQFYYWIRAAAKVTDRHYSLRIKLASALEKAAKTLRFGT